MRHGPALGRRATGLYGGSRPPDRMQEGNETEGQTRGRRSVQVEKRVEGATTGLGSLHYTEQVFCCQAARRIAAPARRAGPPDRSIGADWQAGSAWLRLTH